MQATAWVQEQVNEARATVEAAEAALAEYRSDALTREGGTYETSTQQLGNLSSQLVVARSERVTAEAQYEQLRNLLENQGLEALAKAVTKEDIAKRTDGFYRYREFLPIRRDENVVSLGEVVTPLIPLPHTAKRLNATSIIVKDEGRLPTGSFKARGLALAVSMAKELGLTHLAMPTNGNAGAAMAAYATQAGIRSTVFCPADTPEVNVSEIELQGATVYRVNGLINDCGKIVGEGKGPVGWFDLSTLKEPYRIEGKKTMGLELAEQMGWQVPDVIFYPTGGGTGLIGMWKAFQELEAIGWLGQKKPRMVAVQATGCAPIVKAYEAKKR